MSPGKRQLGDWNESRFDAKQTNSTTPPLNHFMLMLAWHSTLPAASCTSFGVAERHISRLELGQESQQIIGFLRLFLPCTNRGAPRDGRMSAEPEPQWKPIRDSSRCSL